MKKHPFILVAVLFISLQGISQATTPDSGKVGKTVNKVGNKTAHVAVKATSSIVDKKYKDKVGPQGETVYINNKSQYYYVDGKGKKVFITKDQIKDKDPKN